MDRFQPKTSRFTSMISDTFSLATQEVGKSFTNMMGAGPSSSFANGRVSAWGQVGAPMNIGRFSSYQESVSRPWDRGEFAAQRQTPAAQAGGALGGAVGGTPIGVAGNTGTKADDANAELTAASAKYGVPVNFLKTILIRESSGDWARDGSRLWNGRPSMGPLLPYVGIFDVTWKSWGCPGDVYSAMGNKAAQIDCMAKGARLLYDKAKAANPAYDWKNVFSMYFGGNWEPVGFTDENGLTDYTYVNNAMADMARFDQMAGGAGYTTPSAAAGAAAGGFASGISTLWGGKGTKDLSYGWNAPNNLGLYSYGTSYGMDGNGHTGVDVPMGLNETAYSPVSGTVVCACTGNGSGADGGGCGAFSDVMGNGCGRIEVKLDNGHTVIFGHMSSSAVRVGDRINAGQAIGGVGGMNGAHVHLEYRIPDPSTPSRWRIVDPNMYLAGMSAAIGGQPGPQSSMPAYNPDVPFAEWGGRTLSQNRMSRTYGQFDGYTSKYRSFR